jgi:DNA-binding CsgD family transcriptional regulator
VHVVATRFAIPDDPIDLSLVERVTIRAVEDIHDAAVTISEVATERGLRIAACSDIASKEPMVDGEGAIINGEIFGWIADGERWWEDTRLALSSPLPRACRYEGEPFWCNADGFYGPWRNKYLDEMSLADFHKRALCRSAIVVPVHLPFDLSAEFEAHAATLGAIGRRFIAGYVGVMRTQQWMPADCKLSKREVECLRWAAIGKTDGEISMILSRSHATVRYHVHRAGEKLNAVNRSQTVFKAGQLGYLGAAG